MIKHQVQTLDDNCMSACLAMILGKPVDEVTKEYHQKYQNHEMTPMAYLAQNGVATEHYKHYFHEVVEDEVAVLTVPSFNGGQKLHAIIYDARTGEFFDPHPNKEYRYTHGVIKAFNIDFIVKHAPAIGVYRE